MFTAEVVTDPLSEFTGSQAPHLLLYTHLFSHYTVRLCVEQTDSSTLCKTGRGGQMFDGFAILCNDTVEASCVRKTA